MGGKQEYLEFHPSFDTIGSLFKYFPLPLLSHSLGCPFRCLLLIRCTGRVSTIEAGPFYLLLGLVVITVDGKGLERFHRIFQRLKEDTIYFLGEKGKVAEVICKGLTIGTLLLHFSSNIIIIVLFSADRPCRTHFTTFKLLHLGDLKDGVSVVLTVDAGAG